MRLTNYEVHLIKEIKVQSNGKILVQILYVIGIAMEPRGPYFKFRELTKKKKIVPFWFSMCIAVLKNPENAEWLGILPALANPP